jgi:hypothetical protein
MWMAALAAIAQTPVNKSFPVAAGQKIHMTFDYPELVRVTTWEQNVVQVTGTVMINGGENDDAYSLDMHATAGTVHVKWETDVKSLPSRITVRDKGQKITFKNKDEYRKYVDENGKDHRSISWGSDVEIMLEIKVPKNVETYIKSVYGLIEVKNFKGPLIAESTYRGIDAAIVEKSTGEVKAETGFGQIYSNLESKFSGEDFRDFHTSVSVKPGNGPSYSFESKFGNVYLRKETN